MTDERREEGFEHDGRFYTWHISDHAKDLLLIDTFSRLPADEFFRLMDEGDLDMRRTPVMLALIATSLRHGNPDWSYQKVERTVMDSSLSDFEFVTANDEDAGEGDAGPPALTGPSSTGEQEQQTGFSPSSTPPDGSDSETLYAIPA